MNNTKVLLVLYAILAIAQVFVTYQINLGNWSHLQGILGWALSSIIPMFIGMAFATVTIRLNE